MEHVLHSSKLLTFCFFLFSISIHAQTDTLVNPNKEGGFELGNGSFAANGWLVASDNTVQVNQWTAGSGATQGFRGNNCAYITDQPNVSPSPHHYTPQQGSTVHFYRDVTFPAGKTLMNIFFMYINNTPNAPIRVALVHRDSDLTTGITLALLNENYSYYSFWGYNFDPSVIGNCDRDTTWRLVFSWTDPISGVNSQPPPAIDFIQITAKAVLPAFSGPDSVFTIDKTKVTNGSNFKSFKEAINAINANIEGFCSRNKPLIFNVIAGQVFEETSLQMTVSGTTNAPIAFRKFGSGVNPVIKPKPIGSNPSSGFTLLGSDFITMDGIDIDGRTDSTWFINNGYLLISAGSNNGAQNNTIKNCTITLDSRAKTDYVSSTGILQTTGNNYIGSAEGANSRNRYLNVNIYNCYNGIATQNNYDYLDSLIEIGTTDPSLFCEIGIPQGDDIANAAIVTNGATNFNIHHIKSTMPIYLNNSRGDNNRIYNNKIITQKGDCALSIAGLLSLTGVGTVDVFNNFLSMTRSKTRKSSYDNERASLKIREYSTTPEFNIYNNSLFIDETDALSNIYLSACFSNYYGSKAHLLNNIFVNNTILKSQNKGQYCIASAIPNGFTSNYNAFWRADTSTKIGITLHATEGGFAKFSEWQSNTQQDANSIEANPIFLSPTDLHAYGLGIDGKGTTPPNDLSVDIDNEPRTTPFDIGADQFTRQPVDLSIIGLIEPNDSTLNICENTSRKVRILVKNLGSQTLDFAQNAATAKVVITKPVGKDSFSTTISTGILAVDSTKIIEINTFTSINIGLYTFTASITTVRDANRQNDTSVYERRIIAAKPLPLIENFQYYGYLTDWTLSQNVSYYYRGKTDNSLSVNIPPASQTVSEFKLPKLGKIDTTTLFSFDYRIVTSTNSINQIVSNSPNWGKVEILGSTDCGSTFTNIKTIDSTNHRPSVDYQTIQLPLSTFAGKDFVLKFVVQSRLNNQVFMDFDNFVISAPCRALVGMDTIAAPAPIGCNALPTVLTARLVSPNLLGTKYEWQYTTDTTQAWQNLPSTTPQSNAVAAIAKSYAIFYRLKTTCATDGSTRLSNTMLVKPVNLPIVAQLPYRESFENWQSSACMSSGSNDVPSISWLNNPGYGDKSWRRNDEGINGSAGWTYYLSSGSYSPTATSGQYSARFHSVGNDANSYPEPAFDLNIDLSGTSEKQISFDYLNLDGADGLQVSLSSNGGVTFQPIDTPLSTTTSWRRFKYNIPANGSAKSVLRFKGIRTLNPNIYYNTTDIGLDSLTIENITTPPNCIAFSLPQNGTITAQDDQLFSWKSADFATGYRIKIGTTANGSDILPLTDIGFINQYRAPIFYDYQKTYYATLEPYNNIGTAQGCPTSAFTIGKNPNFGGGRDGLDSLQPLSGGYTFANSTTYAANAPNGKAVYSWINPQIHTEVTSFNSSNEPNSGYFGLNSLFKFPFFNENIYNFNNTIYLGSTGIVSFANPVTGYYSNKTIPSYIEPSYGIIAPCHSPLYRGTDSHLYYKNDSTQFVATWWHFYASNNGVQDTSEYITFQVILKSDGSIKFQYNAEESSVGRLLNSKILQNSLIGIQGSGQNGSGYRGIQYRNKGQGSRIFDAQNQSLAIDFQPSKGDLKPVGLSNPQLYSYCLGDIKPTVQIQNNSVSPMNFAQIPATITIKMTGARVQTVIQKIDIGTLASGANSEFTFSTPLSMDTAGIYNFEITVKNALDDNPSNDTLRDVRTVQGSAISLPYSENFNSTTGTSWIQYYEFIQSFRSGGNDGSFLRVVTAQGQSELVTPTLGRIRKGDYIAFDYRLTQFLTDFQPDRAFNINSWDKIIISYTTDCNSERQILDSITSASHTPTLHWRQKAVKLPDSLSGKLVKFFIAAQGNFQEYAFEFDNFYVGKGCDSTILDIGNITAPPSVCLGDTARAGIFQRPIAPGINYKWQYSLDGGTSWSALTAAEGNNYLLPPTFVTTTYRVIGTCTLNQKSDTTDSKLIIAFTPNFASLPYNQSFENWETSSCNNKYLSSNDIPDKNWLNLPQSGSSSWRRNDQQAATNIGRWNYPEEGTYSPTSSQGNYSARIHTRDGYTPIQGSLNLFVNLSGATDKTLAFDYINKQGGDSLRISWSTDGGVSFTPLSTLGTANTWTQFNYSLIGGSEKTIIRFEGYCPYTFSLDDIGLDNVRVFANNFTNDAAISAISPQLFGCQNAVQPLTIKLRNAGIEAINLATTPITVNVSVSGALSRSFTKTVNTGNLAVGALLDVVLDPSFTLSAVGIYNIDASLVSTTDLNAVNNSLKTQVHVVSETNIPFTETFDNNPNLPLGWLGEGGVRIDSSWRYNGDFKIGFNMDSYYYPTLNTKGGSFTLPKIGAVRATDIFSFDIRIARYGEALPSNVDWGNAEAVLSDDCGQTWTTVWTANKTNFNSTNNYQNIRIPLSNWVGKSVIIRFTTTYKSDIYSINFDNFRIDKKCANAPTIAAITGSSSVCYGEKTTLQTTVGSGIGLTWAWQKQDTAAWIGLDTNKLQATTSPLFLPTKYRVVATCLMDSTTATSAPFNISVNTPIYAQLPYRQDFETWQSCGASSSQALPDASWIQQLYTGNGSWRRNDNGANAGWTNPTWGEYTPLSTKGSYSARYHGSQVPYGANSYFDLYLDLSQTSGVKYLSYDYFSSSSGNSLTLSLSKDGGKTFENLDYIYDSNGWVRIEKALYSDSDRNIIRFIGYCYPFSSTPADIGIDNLVVSNQPMPSCVEILTPSAWSSNIQSDVVFKWRSSTGAKGYKIKIGTTQNGSEFLPLTIVGQDTFFKPTQRLGFLTTYFVTVIPFDSLGNARSCYTIQFTTQRNPNFGGGVNGNDPNQPMAGGYFFANSTPAAAAALPSQPAYKWIDPLSNNHTTITTWMTGNSNNGSFTLPNIGFDFSYFGTIYRNNIYVNSNGALHFGAPNTATGANEYIPNSSSPNSFLAACWMDLAAGTDGKVYYGTSPTGEYVVTWWHYHDVAPNGTTIDTAEYITFQAILNPNGTIKVQFNDTESTANNGRVFDILNDALIGIEDASGTMGIQYRNNGGPAPMFSSPLAIAFALNNKLLPVQNPANTDGVSVGNAFPNPSSNQFVFDFYTPQKMVLTLQLSNSLGQIVWTDKSKSQIGWQQKTVDWNELPAGIYWLSVATEQGHRFAQRVVRN